MRIGLDLSPELTPSIEADWVRNADRLGLFGVTIGGRRGSECVRAGAISTTTSTLRLIVQLQFGVDNPVTLAEEVSIVDNLSNGRVVVLADLGSLDAESAAEDLHVFRQALSNRPIQHHGKRWTVPAGLVGHQAPKAVIASPPPSQVEVPVWTMGSALASGAISGLPVVATDPDEIDAAQYLQVGRTTLTGDLDRDRRLVSQWAAVGTTHLLVALPPGSAPAELASVARHLVPEVAMVDFPQVIVSAPAPLPWPTD
jgi:hypothetical protein